MRNSLERRGGRGACRVPCCAWCERVRLLYDPPRNGPRDACCYDICLRAGHSRGAPVLKARVAISKGVA